MAKNSKAAKPKKKTAIAETAKTAFVRGLVARKEAAPAGKDGKLPPGATHEIVGRSATGEPVVKRNRFSLT
jgi:hypothetical protein